MAQFNAEILLTANNKSVLNKINEIERALNTYAQKSKTLVIQDEASARFYRQKLDYLKQQNAQLKIAEDRTKRIAQQTAATTKSLQKRVSAAAGGGLIGAGFPALFGASKGEVAGGGIGGILGGLVGGQTGAFTGSIIGSAIGKITQARAEVKQLAEELGFSATQAKVLEEAFESAGLKGAENFEKTVTKVSGSGLELKDQVSVIKAATELSRVYRGEVSKIAGAFTDVLLKGKVAVSDLNKLQSQGIPIQDALAKKLGVSRTELLQLTKDGKVSVQTLANEFINLGNNAKDAPAKAKGEFDKLTDALLDAAAGVGTLATNLLRILKPAIEQLTKDVTNLINKINELIRIGPVGDLQREITGGKLRDYTSFGATPETVLNLEDALKNVTAEGLKSKDAIDAVELAVARAAARSQDFKGKAGELAEKTVQVQITRLQKEIAEARQVLGLVETANKDLPNITVPADLDTSDSSSSSAPQSKALQLQQQLIREELKRNEIRVKALQLVAGEEAALKAQQTLLTERLAKETAVIELARQQALESNKVAGDVALINDLHDSQLKTITEQLQLQYAQNNERLRAIALERELQQLKADQAFATESTGFSRELEDIQARTANPFGGFQAEQLELATAQARRYEDAMRDIANQEELLRAQRTDANASTIDPQLAQLERKKQLYEEMLPAIAAAEQAELKMAQTLQALQPITDGLAAGITDFFTSVIDGSKSAEEAFADMLKGMGQALIQQAAVMIAQYIAIGIAKAFAGMGSSPTMSNGNPIDISKATGIIPVPQGYATGGFVGPNRVALVGEQGPELIRSGPTGTTVTNNPDTQSAMERFSPSNAETSQSILSTPAINYNGPLLKFNSEDYIPRSEANNLIDAGAKQGEQRAINRLRQSRSSRQKIGI